MWSMSTLQHQLACSICKGIWDIVCTCMYSVANDFESATVRHKKTATEFLAQHLGGQTRGIEMLAFVKMPS